VHSNVSHCRRCGDRFPEPWPSLPSRRGGGGSGPAGDGPSPAQRPSLDSAWANLSDKLGSDLPSEVKEQVKAAIDKQALVKKPTAVTHVAGQRLQVALKKKQQLGENIAKKKDMLATFLGKMRDITEEIKEMQAEAAETEKEVTEAAEELKRAVRAAVLPASPATPLPGGTEGDSAALADLRLQFERLRQDNEALRAQLAALHEVAATPSQLPVLAASADLAAQEAKDKDGMETDHEISEPAKAKLEGASLPVSKKAKTEAALSQADLANLDHLSPEALLLQAESLAKTVEQAKADDEEDLFDEQAQL
jgi:uncharacterized protein YoxC